MEECTVLMPKTWRNQKPCRTPNGEKEKKTWYIAEMQGAGDDAPRQRQCMIGVVRVRLRCMHHIFLGGGMNAAAAALSPPVKIALVLAFSDSNLSS